MSASEVSRRTLLKTAAWGAAGATLNLGAIGRALAAGDLTVGIVYVGARDDFGWNQAHAVAAEALKLVPGVKVVEEENVPETDACAKTMESMINLDGAGLILATSFGYYTPFVVDMAKKYPNVQFRHAAPLVEQGQGSEERRQLFRLSQPGALRERRRGRACTNIEQDRLRRGQADCECAQQYQLGPARRAQDQSEGDRPGDLHRRLVDAGARGRGGERARRRRLRRHHLPRRLSEGGDRDGRKARRQNLRP